jgi:hypothetical protein
MAGFGTGLLLGSGKCAGNSHRINDIRYELVFRGAPKKCSHNPNEVSALRAELVFRDAPGQLIQRRGQTQRFRLRFLLRRPLIQPIGDGVTWVPLPPTGLCSLPARRLTIRLPAGMLPLSDP